ncbi:MAG: protein-L-isoaspartate(D-aspartate) O-methyltransferase [Acidobacteria bacterium]|nr:protein-L-isoaspartate(D-aspartate) O-methyltransferase [Acidobacteriota bacterium]
MVAAGPRWLVAGLALAVASCAAGAHDEARMSRQREDMVSLLKSRDITDPLVLDAMARIPRHEFVPAGQLDESYQDSPVPIGHGQTISQPYIVALMTQLARAAPGKKALDVGTGSGYQAAVLAEIVDHVYTIEIICELAEQARERLQRLGYRNVTGRCGDGYAGWPEQAPFDLIVVAAAPREVPQPLIDQLAPGGRLVIPVGGDHQELLVVAKREDGSPELIHAGAVRFVPMTGEAERGP